MAQGEGQRVLDVSALRGVAERHGQGHVFGFWDRLDPEEREELLEQVGGIDFELVERLCREHLQGGGARHYELSPAPVVRIPRTAEEKREEREAFEAGEEILRSGKVAVLLVAGGQGTRLGYDGPKGAFEIGPVTRRSLFQIHGEKILAMRKRYGASIPWYIMTSEANHDPTVAHLSGKDFFGLGRETVRLFKQGMIPAVDRQGRLILGSRSRIFTNPDGHGGTLKALYKSGCLAEMRQMGIETISYFQVDNVTVNVCDPVFIGRHALAGAEMSSKVIRKRDWKEKLGVVGLLDGKLTVIEYSDLSDSDAQATLDDGSLKYWAGSVAIHILSVGFVERLTEGEFGLPYHRAEKAIPHVDERGELVKPSGKNGVKFETFIFDALGQARGSVTMEVRREDEFSPVKNATGQDSPETAKRDMTRQYVEWLEISGAQVERGPDGSFPGHVEISPLTALGPADLRGKVPAGTIVRDGFVL